MKNAIVYVHGGLVKEQGEATSTFIKDIKEHYEKAKNVVEEIPPLKGHVGQRLILSDYANTTSTTTDIYEVFWADVRNTLLEKSHLSKAVITGGILRYWLTARGLFRKADTTKRWTLLLTIGFIVVWYLAIVALLGAFVFEFFAEEEQMAKIISDLKYYEIGIALSTLLVTTPYVIRSMDVIHFIKQYLTTSDIRIKIRKRIKEIVHELIESGEYDQITVVGDSFGAAIATDFVAHLDLDTKAVKIRLVTFGAALSFMAKKEAFVNDWIEKVHKNERVDAWYDFFSNYDWLSSRTRVEDQLNTEGTYFWSLEVPMDKNITKRFSNHLKYSKNNMVLTHVFSQQE